MKTENNEGRRQEQQSSDIQEGDVLWRQTISIEYVMRLVEAQHNNGSQRELHISLNSPTREMLRYRYIEDPDLPLKERTDQAIGYILSHALPTMWDVAAQVFFEVVTLFDGCTRISKWYEDHPGATRDAQIEFLKQALALGDLTKEKLRKNLEEWAKRIIKSRMGRLRDDRIDSIDPGMLSQTYDRVLPIVRRTRKAIPASLKKVSDSMVSQKSLEIVQSAWIESGGGLFGDLPGEIAKQLLEPSQGATSNSIISADIAGRWCRWHDLQGPCPASPARLRNIRSKWRKNEELKRKVLRDYGIDPLAADPVHEKDPPKVVNETKTVID